MDGRGRSAKSDGDRAAIRRAEADGAGGVPEEVENLYRHAPLGLCAFDTALRWIRINERMAAMTGFPAEAHIGKRVRDLLPELADLIEGPMREVIATGRPRIGVEISSGAPGAPREWTASWMPLNNSTGEVVGITMIAEDVLERKAWQRAAQGALRAEEKNLAQLETVLDHLTEGLVIADLEGNLYHWNRAAIEMHGFASLDECRRKLPEFAEIFELSNAEGRILPVEEWPLARILRGETLTAFVIHILHKSAGWRRIFHYGGTLARDSEGTPLLAVVSVTDVTQTARAQEALREREDDLKRAQAVAHTGSWRIDVHTNEITWSDECYRIFGVPLGTPMTYAAFLDLVHSDDRAHVQQRWSASLHGELYDIEHRIVAGGAVKWVRERSELEFDREGRLRGGFGTAIDITELKRVQEELRQANALLEHRVAERTQDLARTVDSLRDEVSQRVQAEQEARERARMIDAFFSFSTTPLVILDRDFNFIRVNESYARACQKAVMDFPGHNHFEFYPHEENEAIFRQVVTTRKPFTAVAKPFSFPDHSEWGVTYWDWTLTPLLDGTGEVEFLVFTLENVSARVQAEEALRSRAVQLRALAGQLTLAEQRERRRMAKLLHDHLQQLLVAAKFRAAVLGRSENEEVRDGATEIAALLTESIRASRSLTAELSPPILHEGGLSAGLEWLARWMADKHGLAVDLRLEPDLPELPEEVRVLLFESVRELLFNAVKHARVHAVSVSLRRLAGDALRLSVSDDGCGFDPQQIGPPGEKGTGFGLFSIRERLDLIGGSMEIDSTPGGGSRFMLTTPLAAAVEDGRMGLGVPEAATAAPGTATPQRAPTASPARSSKIRVLLADDHAVMREGLARLLSEEDDIEVVGEATDGRMAVEQARLLLPDVILMDMSMPRLNGIDATRAIRTEAPGARVIGLSMFEETERAQAMLDAGAVAYLTKSGPAAELVAAIRSHAPPEAI
ncbi:MAG: PAS domain-containing protein [Candidatus Eisenbacteria bacterium]